MKFLEVFNEIEKGNYALTDEAMYASIKNSDKMIPLYGGNQSHKYTDRRNYNKSRWQCWKYDI